MTLPHTCLKTWAQIVMAKSVFLVTESTHAWARNCSLGWLRFGDHDTWSTGWMNFSKTRFCAQGESTENSLNFEDNSNSVFFLVEILFQFWWYFFNFTVSWQFSLSSTHFLKKYQNLNKSTKQSKISETWKKKIQGLFLRKTKPQNQICPKNIFFKTFFLSTRNGAFKNEYFFRWFCKKDTKKMFCIEFFGSQKFCIVTPAHTIFIQSETKVSLNIYFVTSHLNTLRLQELHCINPE